MASLSKIAELSYERDADGQVVMQNGKPVIGEDFFGFVDNVVGLDLEHRAHDVSTRLQANSYRSEEERTRDQRVNDALQVLREESAATSPALEAQPDATANARPMSWIGANAHSMCASTARRWRNDARSKADCRPRPRHVSTMASAASLPM